MHELISKYCIYVDTICYPNKWKFSQHWSNWKYRFVFETMLGRPKGLTVFPNIVEKILSFTDRATGKFCKTVQLAIFHKTKLTWAPLPVSAFD